MITGRKPMISGIRPPIGTNSGGRKSPCSQSCRRMISDAYTYFPAPIAAQPRASWMAWVTSYSWVALALM